MQTKSIKRPTTEIFMNASIPLFIDASTVRHCPNEQIDRIIETKGYESLITEEVIDSVKHLDCANWIELRLAEERLRKHQIVHQEDIRLLLRVSKCCGACRSEVCSYLGARREHGIVITQDPTARKLLSPHFPEVTSYGPVEFLRKYRQPDQQQMLSDKKVVLSSLLVVSDFSKANVS